MLYKEESILKRLMELKLQSFSLQCMEKKYIAKNGFDPEYGARPVKRVIQRMILDQLADKIIGGQIKDGQKVKVSFEKSGITVSS